MAKMSTAATKGGWQLVMDYQGPEAALERFAREILAATRFFGPKRRGEEEQGSTQANCPDELVLNDACLFL
jgi:hypothetical protein